MIPAFNSAMRLRRSGYGDLVLAGGVLLIMSLMVFRLPTSLIDALVAVNISTGVCLLLLAIYVPSPLTFNSFPSVLLISTLFRLSLSVATTRLILLEADAGNIIQAFGSFVAGGNLVVGIVVFTIITVVQFIVIAKGAERVAEVSARFTLDAMPGKQLSIDSDLRSGLIEKDEAKRRRKSLESESQLNGALDGAMKFVKGDAIASIVIVIVNLAGGLSIGMAQRDLDFGAAMETYSILTIGDGMVAQIPALLSAMAAGLIVTRTTSEGNQHLATTIGRQIVSQPRALLLTAAMALLLALTPGFPTLTFIFIALVLLIASRIVLRPHKHQQNELEGKQYAAGDADFADARHGPAISISQPLVIEIPEECVSKTGHDVISAEIESARRDLIETLGVPLPSPQIVIAPDLETVRIKIFDVIADSPYGKSTASDCDGETIGNEVWATIKSRASDFLGIQEVTDLLERVANDYPALVREVSRHLGNQQIAAVLRHLIDEGIPIRDLRTILESLAVHGEREKNPAELSELVRIGLKHLISRLYRSDDGELHAVALGPEAEALVRAGLSVTPAGIVLSLPINVTQRLRDAISIGLNDWNEKHSSPLLVVPADIRRHLHQSLSGIFPRLRVVSFSELLPNTKLDIKATIGI